MAEGFEQLQLEGMEHFEVPTKYLPTFTTRVEGLPEWRDYRVSTSGQFTVPASARERWGLRDGGDVNVIDIDGAVVVFPTDIPPDTARELLVRMLHSDTEILPTETTQALGLTGIANQIRPEFE